MENSIEQAGSKFPIDVSTLKKGTVITVPELETILDCRADTRDYAWRLWQFSNFLGRELKKAGKPGWTIYRENGNLIIADDQTASQYNSAQYAHCLNRMELIHYRQRHVDADKLTPVQQQGHQRNLEVESRILQAIAIEKAKLLAG